MRVAISLMLFVFACLAEPPYTTRYTDYFLRFATSAEVARGLLEIDDIYATSFTNSDNEVLVLGYAADDRDIIVKFGYKAGQNIDDTWGADEVNWGRGTYIGYQAGYGATDGGRITTLGHRAGYYTTNAPFGVFLGFAAGLQAADAYKATAVGYRAGGNGGTTITEATLLGHEAGRSAGNVSWSVFIGHETGETSLNSTNSVLIGHSVNITNRPNETVIGGAGITKATLVGVWCQPAASYKAPTGTDIHLWNSNGVLFAVSASATNQILP